MLISSSGYMDYLGDMPGQLMAAMALVPENTLNIATMLLAWTGGYLLYTRAFTLWKVEKVDPYPIWIHCSMLGIDIVGTITFWMLAFANDFFWMFVLQGIALPIWVVMEVISIRRAVKHDRQREFGRLVNGPVSTKQAWLFVAGMTIAGFAVVQYGLSMIGGFANAAIWIIYPFTNYAFAFWTWRHWAQQGVENNDRRGNSMFLLIVILVNNTIQWVPGLSWWLNVSPFFNQPWFYFCGIVASGVAAYNLYMYSKLRKKELLPSGRTPVW